MLNGQRGVSYGVHIGDVEFVGTLATIRVGLIRYTAIALFGLCNQGVDFI